ncbi:hypothetical protein [Microbulbifer sp. MCCC 1A16149]|uniref:hypothetical protein n=1 Tax=Microbulbifer sp. MCCC 1A16149 TaxID=3411322 RepID=UPI003D1307C7
MNVEAIAQLSGFIIAVAMIVAWFWGGMKYAMIIYVGCVAAIFAVVFAGGPQMIAGVITGVIANEITRAIRQRKQSATNT